MTGQGVMFRLGAELLEQPELDFNDAAAEQSAAAAAPAAVGAVARSCRSCGLVHSAYEGTPLIETCPEYRPAEPERIRRQRETLSARYDDIRNHRRNCGNCIPGARPCKDGRKADKEARVARDVLRLMLDGEL